MPTHTRSSDALEFPPYRPAVCSAAARPRSGSLVRASPRGTLCLCSASTSRRPAQPQCGRLGGRRGDRPWQQLEQKGRGPRLAVADRARLAPAIQGAEYVLADPHRACARQESASAPCTAAARAQLQSPPGTYPWRCTSCTAFRRSRRSSRRARACVAARAPPAHVSPCV